MHVNETLASRDLDEYVGPDQVRKKANNIFGNETIVGAQNAVNEIILNSLDEASEDACDEITCEFEEDNTVTVIDNGRGLPMHWNEAKGKYNWEMALNQLFSSGKYKSGQYSNAAGTNGLGLTATQYASEFMQVESIYSDGVTNKKYTMGFKKGFPDEMMPYKETVIDNSIHSGTKIKFKLDKEVFPELSHKKLDVNFFITRLRYQAMLLPGLKIIVKHYSFTSPLILQYDGGCKEFMDSIIEKPMISKSVYFEDEVYGSDAEADPVNYADRDTKYRLRMGLAFNFSRNEDVPPLNECYHNRILMSKSVVLDAFQLAVTRAFNDYARANGKIKANDKFTYRDIGQICYFILWTTAPGNLSMYEGQIKSSLYNPFIKKSYDKFVYEKFQFWFESNQAIAAKVIDEVVANKTAREEAAKVTKSVISSLSKAISLTNKPKNFKDCTSEDVSIRELYIVEGRSALGSVKFACNPKFQAVIPVRGKVLNCIKKPLTEILQSQEIIDIYRVLGCGIEARSKYIEDLPPFDISKLNYSKIIICTDADIDGHHIKTLLLVMLFRLSPTLIKEGKVYIALSPLFEIVYKDKDTKKETIKFAYDEAERDAILTELSNEGYNLNNITINRSKGLGENDADMMAVSTMNPQTRRLIKVEYPETPEQQDQLALVVNALLGDDIDGRKLFIQEYFKETKDEVDSLE